MAPQPKHLRRLLVVLGDQLDRRGPIFDDFDPRQDAVWMAEAPSELTHVWAHKQRILFFLSAMRHFRDELRKRHIPVVYHELRGAQTVDSSRDHGVLLLEDLQRWKADEILLTWPGDWRVKRSIEEAAGEARVTLRMLPDRHFICSCEEFAQWARGKKSLLLETFYRYMRRKHHLLVDSNGEPEGGRWNYDAQNRAPFGQGPPAGMKTPRRFHPDLVTREVLQWVERRFSGHPGELDAFSLPVNRDQALALLREFIEHRLPMFGKFQDAMWNGRPFLFHSRLAAALNVKLLSPWDCLHRALAAYREGTAPLASVEGFVRQILGWREYIHGIYWLYMPEYANRNALKCEDRPVPQLLWTGETHMRCVADGMKQLLQHGYTHHIYRLMVFGQLCLLLGVHPRAFHEWHMAMYVDAVDWVSLPNALGMSQFADGGIVGTKPYCASGNYIQRMSNYCSDCRYHPRRAAGDQACPFTTLYWDFLARHQERLADNPRMSLQLRNLRRKDSGEIRIIRAQARALRRRIDAGERI